MAEALEERPRQPLILTRPGVQPLLVLPAEAVATGKPVAMVITATPISPIFPRLALVVVG